MGGVVNPSRSLVRLIPLGGLGEIGLNLMVLECAGEAIIIDAGVIFPRERDLGVDVVVPDLTALEQLGARLLAVLLTHGHEDHVGALPHLLGRFNLPVYGSELALGFARRRLSESGTGGDLVTLTPRREVEFGPFKVRPIPVTHSVPGSMAFAIDTPAGLIVHTGDFKIDDSPVEGEPFDRAEFARLGERGVMLLMSDSTNVERAGRTPSESSLRPVLEEIIARAPGKLFLSVFSSHLHRIRQLALVSQAHGRKVVPIGRRMVESVRLGIEYGQLSDLAECFADLRQIDFLHPHRLSFLASGSQGEPLSALVKVAAGVHPRVVAGRGDVVMLSSRFIPGNEQAINNLINHLYKRGAEVYYETVAPVHVSGHASRDELAEIIRLTRPRYFLPIHGEYRHLARHRALAIEHGVDEPRCWLLENGESLNLTPDGINRGQRFPAGRVRMAGGEPFDDGLLKMREALARDGAVAAVLVVSKSSGEILGGPDLISHGAVSSNGDAWQLEEARAELAARLREIDPEILHSEANLKRFLVRSLRSYFRGMSGRQPVVIPHVMEV